MDEIFTGDFASSTVHFFTTSILVKNQQIPKLFINLLIMYGSSYMFRHYIAILRELTL
jgi:hypothetical protein